MKTKREVIKEMLRKKKRSGVLGLETSGALERQEQIKIFIRSLASKSPESERVREIVKAMNIPYGLSVKVLAPGEGRKLPGTIFLANDEGDLSVRVCDISKTEPKSISLASASRKAPYFDAQSKRIGFGPTYGEFSYNFQPIRGTSLKHFGFIMEDEDAEQLEIQNEHCVVLKL